MKIDELRGLSAPFDVMRKKDGRKFTVIGCSENDPLGVFGGIFPDVPTIYFKGGGWLLAPDFLNNYEIDRQLTSEREGE